MKNQPIVRLSFTCDRNWENMVVVKDGRFCNDCQKKVVDFTDKTNDEIAAYLMSSTAKVCGRFQQSQLASSPTKPLWKRWFSAAAMFATVFIGIKEASAQTKKIKNKTSNHASIDTSRDILLGDVIIPPTPETIYHFSSVEVLPSFPGGKETYTKFLNENLHKDGLQGRVIVFFVVEKDGSLSDVKVVRSPGKAASEEAIRVLKLSPIWQPGSKNGTIVRTQYAMPIDFNN